VGATSRRKGVDAEVDVVNWLRLHGYPDARRYLAGDGRQPGDVDGVPGVCLEVKNCARLELPAWLRQVEAEAGPNLPVVVAKLRGITDPGEWAAVLRLRELVGIVGIEDARRTA
jgi:predicted amidohydrolase